MGSNSNEIPPPHTPDFLSSLPNPPSLPNANDPIAHQPDPRHSGSGMVRGSDQDF